MLESIIPGFFFIACTAYSASIEECGKTDGITASGVKAVEGVTVAADHLPFGTKIEIDGHVYTVHDRFGGGYTDRIDIYKESQEDCYKYGRQYALARIIYMPKEEDFDFSPFPKAVSKNDYIF